MRVEGTIHYQDIGTGFWGLIDNTGKQWQILDIPVDIQHEGCKVSAELEVLKDVFTVFMWGTAARIVQFTRIA